MAKAAAAGADGDRKTLVIGVGAQKAGTTWLVRQLVRHPDVHVRLKEVNYWNRIRAPYLDNMLPFYGVKPVAMYNPRPRRLRQLEELFADDPYDHSHYLSYFEPGREGRRIVLDVSPDYARCAPSTFHEMAAVAPDVRFVYLMRDPVERLWSGIRHLMRDVLRQCPDFAHLERAFLEACADPHNRDHRYSRYDVTLDALEATGAPVLCLFYESLFEPKAMARVEAFLEIDGLAPKFDRKVNAGIGADQPLSEAARATARAAFDPAYRAVRARFAAEVPQAWME